MTEKLLELKNSIQFVSPEYFQLFNLVYILLAVWLIIFIRWYQKKPARTVGSRHPWMSSGLRFCLIVIIFVMPLTIVALAWPYIPTGSVQFRRGAIEIVFMVDDSSSMWVKDLTSSRIDIETGELSKIYSRGIIREGDRVGLVVFGKTPLEKLRLTADLDRFSNDISRIGRPQSLIGDDHPFGSDIPAALRTTYQFLDYQDKRALYMERYHKDPPLDFDWEKFSWQPGAKSNRIVIFLGDGDYRFGQYNKDQMKGLNDGLSEFRRRGLKIYSVGIGTKAGVRLDSVLKDYLKYEYNDKLVADLKKEGLTRLDTNALHRLSDQTGGSVATIENSSGSAEEFLKNVIDSNRNQLAEISNETQKDDLWQECLEAAFAFILGAILIEFLLNL